MQLYSIDLQPNVTKCHSEGNWIWAAHEAGQHTHPGLLSHSRNEIFFWF